MTDAMSVLAKSNPLEGRIILEYDRAAMKGASIGFHWLALVVCLLASPSWSDAQTWKINLKNADIREFITQVSTITGKTFVVDPRVKGNVTVVSDRKLDSDAVYALFLSVLRVHGFGASRTGEVVRIVQSATVKQ